MMNDFSLTLYQAIALVLPLIIGLIGLYVRFNNQITLMEARVVNLEKNHDDLELKFDEISRGINQILLVLAENQIHSKS